MIGYITEMYLQGDFPPGAVWGSLEHVVPLAVNTAPHGHLHTRKFNRTLEREVWVNLARTWDSQTAPAFLAFCLKSEDLLKSEWFEPSENENTTPLRERFKRLRILIDNGLDIDHLSVFYKSLAPDGGSEATLIYAFDLLEKFYDGDEATGYPSWHRPSNYDEEEFFKTDQFGRTRAVPPWISENQDFCEIFNREAKKTVLDDNKLVIANDEAGRDLVMQIFTVSGPEGLECLNLLKAKGYQLHSVVGLSLEKTVEITNFIAVRYGIGNIERAARVLQLLINLLPNSKEAQLEKFIDEFLAYADKQAPDSPWRNVMEGNEASINLPGMSCLLVSMLGTPEEDEKMVEDNNVTPERLALIDRFLSLPLSERSKLKPLLQLYLNQTPLLTTQAEETLSLENLADEPRINDGLGDLFSFYELAKQECLSEETLSYYFTFIAPRMPNPLSPPPGFLRLYEHVMHARDTEYMNEVMFANPMNGDRERAKRNQAQKTVNRQTLLADLVHLWGLGLVEYEQLETWLKWVHGSIEDSERQQIREAVEIECDYLHPKHYEGLLPEVAAAKLERLTAGFRREYDLHSADYNAVFELEEDEWFQNEHYDAYYLNGDEVRFSEQEPIDLNWKSLEARYEAVVKKLNNNRVGNLRNNRAKLSGQRLKFLEKVFPLLGMIGQNAAFGSLLSEVIIDLMDSAVALGDIDPLNSPVSNELSALLEAVHTEVTPESYGLPDYLLDRDRLAHFTRESDSALKVLTVFESIRKAYKQTQDLSQQYRRSFEQSMRRGYTEDFEFDGVEIRKKLEGLWHEVRGAVPKNVIDVLMSTQFNQQSLIALATSVKGFREKALSASMLSDSSRFRQNGYDQITGNMLTLGSVGQGLANLATANLSEDERLSSATVISNTDTNLPTLFRPDFKTDPAQMEQAFLQAYPGFKERVKQWRKADFGLLPGGAKVHVIKPFDSSHIQVVKNIFGLDQTSFRLIHADQSLILPPVPSSEELKHMLLLLEHLGIFKGGIDPELQITVPGRLEDPESLAILGSSVILASNRNYSYREEAFGTSHDNQTASRMMAYDAGVLNTNLPMMFGLDGRTDVLGRFDPDDISNYRLIASILIQHEKGVGPYKDLGARFKKDFVEQVLKPHGLSSILHAPWIHPFNSHKRGTPEENTQHYEAVDTCMQRYFADAQVAIETGELGAGVAAAHRVIGELAVRFKEEQHKAWMSGKYEKDKEALFENL